MIFHSYVNVYQRILQVCLLGTSTHHSNFGLRLTCWRDYWVSAGSQNTCTPDVPSRNDCITPDQNRQCLFFPFVSMFFHLPFFWLIIQKCRLLPDFCLTSAQIPVTQNKCWNTAKHISISCSKSIHELNLNEHRLENLDEVLKVWILDII